MKRISFGTKRQKDEIPVKKFVFAAISS